MNLSPIVIFWNSLEALGLAVAIWWLVSSTREFRAVIRADINGEFRLALLGFVISGIIRGGVATVNLLVGVAVALSPVPVRPAVVTLVDVIVPVALTLAQVGMVSLTIIDLVVRRRLRRMHRAKHPNRPRPADPSKSRQKEPPS